MSTNIKGKMMGPPVGRGGELHQGEEDQEEEFVMRDNQCDYAFSLAGILRKQKYNGEKSNKCNQFNYAFAGASNLRTHFKTHKCNKCDFVSSDTILQSRRIIKTRYPGTQQC